MGWTTEGFGSPGRVSNFLHVIQTGSEAHPASYKTSTEALSLGVKRPGRETEYSPINAKVKKIWIYLSTPPHVFTL
jgi:hypothetical protein